jgi:hypothetical protein
MKMSGVSKVKKKSNLESLLLELLSTDDQIKTLDIEKDVRTTEEESKGPSIVLRSPKIETEHQMSDEEMSDYLEQGNVDTSSRGKTSGLEEVSTGTYETKASYSLKM